MKSGYEIRLAQQKDCPGIAEIYRPYIEESAVSFELVAPGADEIYRRMQNIFKKYAWLVCEIDGQVIGYAYSGAFRERIAYQWVAEVSVYVHPDHQNKGIASRLYSALHEIMKAQGFVKSYAGMTVPNVASKKFHFKLGYEQLAYFKDVGYKFDKWHDTDWFCKDLVPVPKLAPELKTIVDLDKDWLDNLLNNS